MKFSPKAPMASEALLPTTMKMPIKMIATIRAKKPTRLRKLVSSNFSLAGRWRSV